MLWGLSVQRYLIFHFYGKSRTGLDASGGYSYHRRFDPYLRSLYQCQHTVEPAVGSQGIVSSLSSLLQVFGGSQASRLIRIPKTFRKTVRAAW